MRGRRLLKQPLRPLLNHEISRAREGQVKGSGGKGEKGQEKEETCAVCQCEFTVTGDSGEGLCCPSSHFLCSECTGVYVMSIMNDLEASYPPKCSMCRAEIPSQSFERQLSQRQQQSLAEFVAQQSLCEKETMMRCPCGYMEIRTDKPILCWCKACNRGECQVCNQVLPEVCAPAPDVILPGATCAAYLPRPAVGSPALQAVESMSCFSQ